MDIDYSSLNLSTSVDLDSPINIIQNGINESIEDGVYKAVVNCGIAIDKEKLQQAIAGDRRRYHTAYNKGYNEGYEKGKEDAINEIKRILDQIWV